MKDHILPNFLIVGAHKAATTSLYAYAAEHPDIYMPEQKEPKYFIAGRMQSITRDYIKYKQFFNVLVSDFDSYAACFNGWEGQSVIGEASPQYLHLWDSAIPGIKSVLGDPKIFIILREPVARALSNYNYLLDLHVTTLSLEDILAKQAYFNEQYPPVFHILNMGLYAKPVEQYRKEFTSVYIYLYDDLVADSGQFIRRFYEDLGVDCSFMPSLNARHNPTLHNISVKPETRRYLQEFFRKDISRLESLLGRSLSEWRGYEV